MRRLAWWVLVVALAGVGSLGCAGDDSPPPDDDVDGGTGGDGGPPRCTDEICDDGIFCNGDEQCNESGVCEPASEPRNCDDGMLCTIDFCSEEDRACVHLPPDADADGHQTMECGGDDCDDMDANRFPGNDEVCDEAMHDEDCDSRSVGARDEDEDGYIDNLCCNMPATGEPVCGTDCNDLDPGSHPTESEVCDLRDNDCDGTVDDGVDVAGFDDVDRDLHGDDDTAHRGCPGTAGFTTVGGDCDDTNPMRHSAQPEICDGVDNDCDGMVDDSTRAVTWYRDLDGDAFGSDQSGTTISCEPVPGYSLLGTDCDDAALGVNPAAGEQCNARDDNCDGSADFVITAGDLEDDDGDGAPDMRCPRVGSDCDDRDPSTRPGATEQCDGRDNDCDGVTDGGGAMAMWFVDRDGDGYGDPTSPPITTCTPQPGRVPIAGDCDDSSVEIHPGVADRCDGRDQDCDMEIDESSFRVAFYRDLDMDGAGAGMPVFACVAPPGLVAAPSDCNDADPAVGPGAAETCNTVDDDCDASVDEGVMLTFHADADSDGFGVAGVGMTRMGCTPPPGFGPGGDCDDANAARFPGATERCDRFDNDCDTMVDELPDAATSCALPGVTTAGCAMGRCTVVSCATGRGDCDLNAATGYEVDLTRTALHCGRCGATCGPGSECSAGSCLSSDFVSIVAADYANYAVRDSGGVAVWGQNTSGRLMTGTEADALRPISAMIDDVVQVAAAANHACALLADGRVACAGMGDRGRLGTGSTTDQLLPVMVPGLSGVAEVTAGNAFTCARLASRQISCWGANPYGQLGQPVTTTQLLSPTLVPGISDAIGVSATTDSVCALRAGGTVLCWGRNASGQLGNGTTTDSPVPVSVTALTDAIALARGHGTSLLSHMCALRAAGTVVCWGTNASGQLGDGTPSQRSTPVAFGTLSGVVSIAIAPYATCAVTTAREGWCTGGNGYGQLGSLPVGATVTTPRRTTATGIVDLALGDYHACALVDSAGTQSVQCWGYDNQGQFGDGTPSSVVEPNPQTVAGIP